MHRNHNSYRFLIFCLLKNMFGVCPEHNKKLVGADKKLQEKLQMMKKRERQIKPIFDEAFSVLQEAFDMYSRSKHHIIVWRYGEIKTITKDSINIGAGKKLSNTCPEDNGSNTLGLLRGLKLLKQRAALIAENAQIEQEIGQMSKGELKRNIEQTKNQIAEMKTTLEQLDKDIMQLNEKYQESKSLFFLGRYRSRKRTLKAFLLKYEPVLWKIKRPEMIRRNWLR